jgi:hypothetical protein
MAHFGAKYFNINLKINVRSNRIVVTNAQGHPHEEVEDHEKVQAQPIGGGGGP